MESLLPVKYPSTCLACAETGVDAAGALTAGVLAAGALATGALAVGMEVLVADVPPLPPPHPNSASVAPTAQIRLTTFMAAPLDSFVDEINGPLSKNLNPREKRRFVTGKAVPRRNGQPATKVIDLG
ncbi:hypothetical protein [Paraburkholderia elongata]|uniref:hypothetical protein n=1 Tax=Paraburkholderia elongata TaxID=2675747 RepID=UPI001556F7E9|nr:hypothetical protein [Paraburkholderia elongata]